MVTVGNFRQAIEDMTNFIFEYETDDFVEQIERFEADGTAPKSHIFLCAFTAHLALCEAEGLLVPSLGECLELDYELFICQNRECEYIGSKVDPLQDRLVLELPYNDPVPAGVCPHCGGIARAI